MQTLLEASDQNQLVSHHLLRGAQLVRELLILLLKLHALPVEPGFILAQYLRSQRLAYNLLLRLLIIPQ
ncbi:hypothetical protein H681_12465 [Pseudomonas sp. ATCC 13867]|nr:hypothetical protein H681_12465 [Pseudomonas sp. ATCC 13867]RFQ21871.1 hypothetical protein D0N87_23705 [Pseudomonas sp. ATCC 13867]